MTSRFIKSLWPCLMGAVLGSAQAQTISFGEAWTRVIQQDEGLAAEQAGVDRAKQLREAAKDMYLPKVDLGASYTHLDQPIALDALDLNPLAKQKDLILALGSLFGVGANAFVTP